MLSPAQCCIIWLVHRPVLFVYCRFRLGQSAVQRTGSPQQFILHYPILPHHSYSWRSGKHAHSLYHYRCRVAARAIRIDQVRSEGFRFAISLACRDVIGARSDIIMWAFVQVASAPI